MRMERGTRTGTKHISMPMFVMLRRFTIPMTMLAEYQVAGIKPPTDVVVSVAVLCMGAMIAVKDFQTELWVVSGACPPVRAPSRVVVRLTVAQLARLVRTPLPAGGHDPAGQRMPGPHVRGV